MGYLLLLIISLGLFTLWQYSPALACPDTFYHAKMSQLIYQQGIIFDFPWQQFTILKDNYIDHHFLFHILTIPFTIWLEPTWGLKIASIIFSSLFILLFYWILKKYKIRFAFYYSAALLFIIPFVSRLNLAKAPAWSLIFLFLGLYFILQKKHYSLLILSFLYVWLYDGWPLILLLVLVYLAINISQFKKNYKILLSCVGGLVAGIIINPYFPTNLIFYKFHIINIGLINFKNQFSVGQEWYPYALPELVMENNLAFIFFFLGLAALFASYIKNKLKNEKTIVYLLMIALVFLTLTIRSRRFIEYFIPLAVFFSGFSLNLFFKNYPAWPYKIKEYWKKKNKRVILLTIYLIFALGFSMIKGTYLIYKHFTPEEAIPLDKYQAASQWLKYNTQPQETIFNSDWDDWPLLFYHNSNNNYIVGLDPTFMYNYDPELFQLWQDIIEGQVKENLGRQIKNNFQSEYIFINHSPRRQLFLARLKQDPQIELVYQDEEVYIFKIND